MRGARWKALFVRRFVKGKTPAELGGPLGTREVGDWVAGQITKAGIAHS